MFLKIYFSKCISQDVFLKMYFSQGGGNAGKSAASNINLRAMFAIAQQCNRIEGALELQ